jgi:pimeloyl-ACP methyl ester carboxylesterase
MRHHHVSCLSPAGFHNMHYVEWGDANNPNVVVCAHGLTRQGRDFDVLAQALAKDFRVVCPDVVGRGQSDWLRDWRHYQYPQYVQDMATLLARINPRQLYWVGTSMGGIIGMALAAMPGNPIARLVLNDVGSLITKLALTRIGEYVGRDPEFANIEEYERFMRALSPFGPMTDADWRHFATHQIKTLENGRVKSRYDPAIGDAYRAATQGKPIEDIDLSGYWNGVACPALVIRGETSDLLSPETFAAMCTKPNVQGYTAVGCGHAPSLTRGLEVDAITRFLNAA